jgi:hypothetical protein
VVVITKANQKRIEESLRLPGDPGSLVDLEGTQSAAKLSLLFRPFLFDFLVSG